ncbi:hypothetical protein SNOG_00286 [Parastagonospora nodorum SN15]|uniref:Uncharacterized protein n=1 Tax=Phaeosphaeria nodorum (strain SN15 / ATCC MYA-4574 / FGSC 10173) TaxID=321614 RepID=Q0V6S8_PHANO|nr:hypothetical protein SNOG_00286 [Parastagonospora nodorum SN15]EAT91781.1 hypothetical protein SNOG_00286 [Parastagonospora nodorum SN15]
MTKSRAIIKEESSTCSSVPLYMTNRGQGPA